MKTTDGCKSSATYAHTVGEHVVYGNNGICRITDICRENVGGMGEREYYQLQSVYDAKLVIYVPVDSEGLELRMRQVLTAQQIEQVIAQTEDCSESWIDNSRQRAVCFGDILSSGNSVKILWLVKVLSQHKRQAEQENRKLCAGDARVLSTAERRITEEFSFSLGIPQQEVIPYILRSLGRTGSAI